MQKFHNPSTTPSGRKVKFTLKCIIVGGERGRGGGLTRIFLTVQSYSFGNWGPHAKFQNPSTATSVRIWVRVLVLLLVLVITGKQSQLPVLALGGSLTKIEFNLFHCSDELQDTKGWYIYLHSDPKETGFQNNVSKHFPMFSLYADKLRLSWILLVQLHKEIHKLTSSQTNSQTNSHLAKS